MFTCDVKSAGVSSLSFVCFSDLLSQRHAALWLDCKLFRASDTYWGEKSFARFIGARSSKNTYWAREGSKASA